MRAPATRPRTGRPYSDATNLGKILNHLNMRVADLAAETDISPRTLTEYLAGRQKMLLPHRVAIARALDVKPSLLG